MKQSCRFGQSRSTTGQTSKAHHSLVCLPRSCEGQSRSRCFLAKEGKPYSVRYDQVNAMLLNEFLKEHRKVEQLEKQVAALTAGLQKVSAQLELTKSAPQTVLNDH